jgi:DNA-binding NtrC family response regulator
VKRHSILVIDHQQYWRELAAEALRSAGYAVTTAAIYDEVLPQHQDFALILLGCAGVEPEERLLIMRLLARKQYVIVLAASLSAQVMRALFIKGVEDAGDKTYDAADLVETVERALERIRSRKSFQYPLEREIYYE